MTAGSVLPGLLPKHISVFLPRSPSSLCLRPLQRAHPVRWPLDSTFLRADLFAVAASVCSHSGVGSKARDWGGVEGDSDGPPWGSGPAFRDQRAPGDREESHPRLGASLVPSQPRELDHFLPTLHLLLLGEAQRLGAPVLLRPQPLCPSPRHSHPGCTLCRVWFWSNWPWG